MTNRKLNNLVGLSAAHIKWDETLECVELTGKPNSFSRNILRDLFGKYRDVLKKKSNY